MRLDQEGFGSLSAVLAIASHRNGRQFFICLLYTSVGSGLEVLAPAQTAKAMLDALEKAVRDALAGNEVG